MSTVIKIGGGTLRGENDFLQIEKLVKKVYGKVILVVSALPEITNKLINAYLQIKKKDFDSNKFVSEIKKQHFDYMGYIKDFDSRTICGQKIMNKINSLESVLIYMIENEDVGLVEKELLQSYGERLSVILLKYFLLSKGIDCESFESEEAGIVCSGDFEHAIINEYETSVHLKNIIGLEKKVIIFTGFYGVDDKDLVKTFGRGGTDYSACVLAKIFGAKLLFLKNTLLMEIDPKLGESPPILSIGYDAFIDSVRGGNIIMQLKALEYLKLNNISFEIINITDFSITVCKGLEYKNTSNVF